MPRDYSPDLAELRPAIRRFVTQRPEPVAEIIDRTGEVLDDAWPRPCS